MHLLHQIIDKADIELQFELLDRPSLPPRDQTLTLKDPNTNKFRNLTLDETLALIKPGTALFPVAAKDSLHTQRNPKIETEYHILPLRQQGLNHVGKRQAKRAGNTNEIHFTTKESPASVHNKFSRMHHLLKAGRQIEIHVRPDQKYHDPASMAVAFSNSLHFHPAALAALIPEGCKPLGEALRDKKTGGVISLFMSTGWPDSKATRQVSRVRNYLKALEKWIALPQNGNNVVERGGKISSKETHMQAEQNRNETQASRYQNSDDPEDSDDRSDGLEDSDDLEDRDDLEDSDSLEDSDNLEDRVLKRGGHLLSKDKKVRPENNGQKAQVSQDQHRTGNIEQHKRSREMHFDQRPRQSLTKTEIHSPEDRGPRGQEPQAVSGMDALVALSKSKFRAKSLSESGKGAPYLRRHLAR